MTYPRIASRSWLHISCGSGFTLRNTNRLQWSLCGQVYARTWALADRRTAVVVAVRDWLPAEGAYVCFSARPDPPQRRSFFPDPRISPPERTQVSQRITRHVVVIGGRSETAEEPPGCKWPTCPVPAVTLKALRRTRVLLISLKTIWCVIIWNNLFNVIRFLFCSAAALGDLPHRAAFKILFPFQISQHCPEIWNQTDGRGKMYLTIGSLSRLWPL